MTDSNGMDIDQPRGDETPEWEVFLRETAADPLRHVGSVSAPTEAVAHEQASSLFDGETHSVWLCPAASIARFTDRDLGGTYSENTELGGARQ
jgi:rSAM-partnered protein